MGIREEILNIARLCLRDYAFLKEGEELLLWVDSYGFDQAIVGAFEQAAMESNAKVALLRTSIGENRLGASIPKVLEGAIRECDLLISALRLENAATIDNRNLQRVFASSKLRSIALICPTVELALSEWARFPAELLWSIISEVIRQVRASGTDSFRITDGNGTDLRGRMAFTRGFGDYKLKRPLKWQFFPGADMAEHPLSPLNGLVVFEAMEGFQGILKEPIRLMVEDHWVTKVEGGEEARWLEDMMRKHPNGNYFSEVAIGVNPKAPLKRGLMEKAIDTIVFRHSGTAHFAVGNGGGLTSFEEPESLWHWDGGSLRPTLVFGNEVIIKEGRLTALDSPEVRRVASKYGDPDELLAEAD